MVRATSQNPLTHLLWKRATGDRIYVRPVAAGVFTINDTIGADDPRIRVMVAAGTGVAPFISMIRSEVRRNPLIDLSKWVLLHGASYPTELGYRQELLELSVANRLKYWGTVSRPSAGTTGQATWVVWNRFLHRTGCPISSIDWAWRPTISRQPRGDLRVRGDRNDRRDARSVGRPRVRAPRSADPRGPWCPPGARDSMFYELYDPTPVIDIDDPEVIEPLRARMRAALA